MLIAAVDSYACTVKRMLPTDLIKCPQKRVAPGAVGNERILYLADQ